MLSSLAVVYDGVVTAYLIALSQTVNALRIGQVGIVCKESSTHDLMDRRIHSVCECGNKRESGEIALSMIGDWWIVEIRSLHLFYESVPVSSGLRNIGVAGDILELASEVGRFDFCKVDWGGGVVLSGCWVEFFCRTSSDRRDVCRGANHGFWSLYTMIIDMKMGDVVADMNSLRRVERRHFRVITVESILNWDTPWSESTLMWDKYGGRGRRHFKGASAGRREIVAEASMRRLRRGVVVTADAIDGDGSSGMI
ncbi:hypothetical protein Tco_1314509 [Tanacetum coccineum]